MHFLNIGADFHTVLEWVIHHGYPIMFGAMIIEGPIIIMAASFAAALGYFNLGIIWGLAVLGDLTGDFIWFSLGYFGSKAVIKKYGHFFGVSQSRMEKLKAFLERHPAKMILAIKLSPLLPAPGLITVGSSQISPKRFIKTIFPIIFFKTVLFMGFGYFFGDAYDRMSKYFDIGSYALLIIFIASLLIYFLYNRIAGDFSKKLENS